MHTIVRLYIRTSLIFLFLGLLMGLHFLMATYLYDGSYSGTWISAHVHVILIGFVMMMILGVAQWMFPRPTETDQQYSPERALFVYYLLTISTAIRFIAEISTRWLNGAWVGYIIVIMSVAQILSFGIFFYNIWTRIRPVGSHIREQKGERF